MSTRPSLTSLADLGRSAGQTPLHRLNAPGIAASGANAEVAARLCERVRIGVPQTGVSGVSCIIAELFAATIGR